MSRRLRSSKNCRPRWSRPKAALSRNADEIKAQAARGKDGAATGWQSMKDNRQSHVADLHNKAADKKAEIDRRKAQAAEDYAADAIDFAVAAVQEGRKMSAKCGRSPAHQGARARAPVAFAAAAAGLVALAGCSSSTSSTPAYCSHRTSLENSVKELPSKVSSSGYSGLQSQLNKVESDATALDNAAKSDFPSQTSHIMSSVDALKKAVTALPPSPSAADLVPVAADAASVVSAVKSFTDATSSKCS